MNPPHDLRNGGDRKDLVLAGGTIIDGRGRTIPRGSVRISNSRISSVEDGADPGGEHREVVQLEGMTVLPGLIDLHVHLYGQAEPDKQFATTDQPALLDESAAYLAAVAAENARRTLEAGFTTIREMGGPRDVNVDVARAINGGVSPGPRIIPTSTVEISRAPGTRETHGAPGLGCTGVEAVTRAVREKVSAGAEVIHLVATGAQFGQFPPRMSLLGPDELAAGTREAHKLGSRTTANAPGAQGARDAVLAGVQCIEHGEYLCEDPDLFALMAESGTGFVPTLIVVTAKVERINEAGAAGRSSGLPMAVVERTLDEVIPHRRSFEMAMQAGVLVGLGTDVGAPFTPNGTNARELECFVEYGATEMQAIEAATRVAATILRMDHEIGTLEPGKRADLIVVRGNPLEDIRVLQDLDNIILVVQNGEVVVDRRELSEVALNGR